MQISNHASTVPVTLLTSQRPTTLIFDGGPGSGKTACAEMLSEEKHLKFLDMGKHLRENPVPDEVKEIMRNCGYVPDEYIIPILENQANQASHRSRAIVGVRTAAQADAVFLKFFNYGHKIVYVKLHRPKDECLRLSAGRGRIDDHVAGFNIRWGLYEANTHEVEAAFRKRKVVTILHCQLVDGVEANKNLVLRLLQQHGIEFPEPAPMVSSGPQPASTTQ